jgi:anthranilate phosphoribosyltransferase
MHPTQPVAPLDGDTCPGVLQQLLEGQSLTVEQATALMSGWLQETIPPVLSGAVLAAIQAKGVTSEELVGMARVLQAQSLQAPVAVAARPLVDTCGTGGDGASTFNISTAVAFVAAAGGVAVAKHGNRSASGKVGSADVLEALGVNLGAPGDRIYAAVDTVGITFLFAPGWHPAMKAVVPLRKTLKVRTIFNLLGPLVNPLRPTGQVLGVSSGALVPTVAAALQQLGVSRGLVVYGREGLDEAGLGDVTDLAIVAPAHAPAILPDVAPSPSPEGTIAPQTLDPQTLGLTPAPLGALVGGDVAENAEILRSVLQGRGTPAQRDAVILNGALALWVGERVDSLPAGVELARSIVASGAAWDKLTALVDFLKA